MLRETAGNTRKQMKMHAFSERPRMMEGRVAVREAYPERTSKEYTTMPQITGTTAIAGHTAFTTRRWPMSPTHRPGSMKSIASKFIAFIALSQA
eukprot:2486494-Rhodomonas_salina.2